MRNTTSTTQQHSSYFPCITHLCLVWCGRDRWLSCRQLWWWFWPVETHRPLNELPFQPLARTPAGSCPPEHRGPEEKTKTKKHGHEKLCNALHSRQRVFVNNQVNLPAALVQPSWQQLQWTRCSPSGSRDLRWCLSVDAGNEADSVKRQDVV